MSTTRSMVPRPGATIWLTGLPAAGKTTVANAVDRHLDAIGRAALVLDGDDLRRGLSSDLDLSPDDRGEQARRAAHVAALISGGGIVAIASLVSPYAEGRRRAREIHNAHGLAFYEIWIDTPVSVCEARDPKGLYRRFRAGELRGLTGVDAPYEEPTAPDVHVHSDREPPEAAAARIIAAAGLDSSSATGTR